MKRNRLIYGIIISSLAILTCGCLFTNNRNTADEDKILQNMKNSRAFLKNSPILLLDEATSALDLESEAKIQKAINNLMIGKTIIVIAHRLSTIVNSDEIIVINDGRIAERGKHAELLSKQGIYSYMYGLQG